MRKPKKGKKKAQYSKVATALGAIVVCVAGYFLGIIELPGEEAGSPVYLYSDLNVHYIDVGQGDSILIQTEEHNILIDTGEPQAAQDLMRYLRLHNVQSIDLLIGTHPHSDHIGGMVQVLENFEVEKVVLPLVEGPLAPTTRTYTELLQTLERQEKTVEIAEIGNVYPFGNVVLTILWPDESPESLNNYSVVTRLVYGNVSFLFTGDIEKGVEAVLVENGGLHATVLKAPHHGSRTSSTRAFLETVAPEVIVIQLGNGNSYGHPHEEVLKRYANAGAKVYRTDLNGSVVVSTDGNSYKVILQYGEDVGETILDPAA